MHEIKVQPSIMAGQSFDCLRIKEVQVQVFKSASVVWEAYNCKIQKPIASGRMTFNYDDYDNWGQDDNYICNLVVEKMTLTKV